MARPHRPNPTPRAGMASHVSQETRKEAKIRKRAEAEERNERTRPQDRRQARHEPYQASGQAPGPAG